MSPHISTPFNEPSHLPGVQQHTDAQLAYWLQQAHDKTTAKFIPLNDDIPSTAGIRQLNQTILKTTHNQRRHTAITNHPAGSSVNAPDASHTSRDCPGADPTHLDARPNGTIHGHHRARLSRSVGPSAPIDLHAIRLRIIDADAADVT